MLSTEVGLTITVGTDKDKAVAVLGIDIVIAGEPGKFVIDGVVKEPDTVKAFAIVIDGLVKVTAGTVIDNVEIAVMAEEVIAVVVIVPGK